MAKQLLVHENHADAGVHVVKSQLRIALSYLQIAGHCHEKRRARYVQHARRTHAHVLRFMRQAKLAQDDCAFITANVERLKVALDALQEH